MFAYPFFALTRQQLKTANNKLNIYTQFLKLYDFFFHWPVGLVELLILYASVQFYTPQALDYRLISKTAPEVVCLTFQTSRHEKDGTWSELTWFKTSIFGYYASFYLVNNKWMSNYVCKNCSYWFISAVIHVYYSEHCCCILL